MNRPDRECVIVSGGARGIGAAIVRHYARHGATVLFGDTDTVGAHQLQESLQQEGFPDVYFEEIDFSAPEAWLQVRKALEQSKLRPSLLVANAGAGHSEQITSTPVETFDTLLALNTRSPWLAARDIGPLLAQTKGASMVLIGSVMASFGHPGHSIYTTAKAALAGLLRSLCVELAPDGIRVNMVTPGYILNDPPPLYRHSIPRELWNEFHARFGAAAALSNPPTQPLRFWGEPTDIAEAVAFLHSPAARYISGAELRVDGGLLCQTPIVAGTGNDSWVWTPEMREWLADHDITV